MDLYLNPDVFKPKSNKTDNSITFIVQFNTETQVKIVIHIHLLPSAHHNDVRHDWLLKWEYVRHSLLASFYLYLKYIHLKWPKQQETIKKGRLQPPVLGQLEQLIPSFCKQTVYTGLRHDKEP